MKIALIEKEEDQGIEGFDKVISFCRTGYPNADCYATLHDIIGVRCPVALNLDLWIDGQSENTHFIYRDINILQAYRLSIFDFLANVAKKVFIVQKIIEKESPRQIWISRDNPARNLKFPFLNYFLDGFIPPRIELKYFGNSVRKENSAAVVVEKDKLFFLRLFLAMVRHSLNACSESKNDNILICSDLNKIPVLCDYLNRKNAIFLREELPESLLLYLFKHRINLKLFSDFKLSKRQKNDIEKAYDFALSGIDGLQDTLYIWGLNFTPCVKRYLVAALRNELRSTLEIVDQSHILFERYKIKSLLLDEDKAISKNILAQLCRKYKVRSYVNCHGEPLQKVGYLPLTADKMLLWGQRQKEIFLEYGLEKSRTIVVGSTKYDMYLQAPASFLKAGICRKLKLSVAKPVALIALWPLSKRGDDLLENTIWSLNRQIISTVDSFPDVQIIVKLHPSDESESYLYDLTRELGSDKIRVLKDYDSLALTKGADFLIVCITTMAIDGLAYKKPVILTEKLSVDTYKEMNVFYDGTCIEKLKKSITGIMNGTYKEHVVHWQKAVDAMIDGMDGKASQRIAELLCGS